MNPQNLNWHQLLSSIQDVMETDGEKLKSYVEFYKKKRGEANADENELYRLYQRVLYDKTRFDLITELLYRMENLNFQIILLGIDDCIEKYKKISGKHPLDYVITVRKEFSTFKIYFMEI
ncbi:hypothetical protein C3K47_15690 [Solitalea longa]|uniref:Uncharacterized protein n=1 Tax=Solitalea longa TaxID=2079460 RepID=A0A2S4ZYT9_9SPHI|nr:hypothetical protein [Solitalea longa]POY35500.1 hypothetical protein C3K47_15690 [Solitalea longa]